MTNYRKKIQEKFDILKLTPRERQVDIINAILNSFIDKKFKHVALSASTGIGKSLIGLIVSEILYELKYEARKENKMISFIVSHTNTLIDQYEQSYSDKFDLLRVNGASNYTCEALSTPTIESTAEDCIIGKSDNPSNVLTKCENCEYLKTKRMINKKKHVLTNYAYMFTAMLYSDYLKPRLITLYDEAHLISDTYVSFMKIEITVLLMEKYIKECSTEGLINVSEDLDHLKQNILDKNINEGNYIEFLEDLRDVYSDAELGFIDLADHERVDGNFIGYKIFNKKAKKFGNIKQKITDFLEYRYEHVVEIKDDEIMVSPIFMKDMFVEINNSDYVLFMSATIDSDFIAQTMGLSSNSIDFINGGSIFDPENKKIINCNQESYNYKKMQDKKFMNDACDLVNDIVSEYDDTKGVVLVTSFAQLKIVNENLQSFLLAHDFDIKIFAQQQGQGLYEVLEEFKNYKKPSILLSPSIFEGIDLLDDLCRYIIFFKAPYASLGDKRIKYISNRYPVIYEKLALYKVIQGCGRAVRDVNDYCDTYFLDGALNKLFNSRHNVWKDNFKKYVRE